ncbi:MAG TPA: purine-nucleoside phosphorylase [Anaerolineae bacterium]|nr:purine-nucleoside phosphorylase [Anaerolineae bacterium]
MKDSPVFTAQDYLAYLKANKHVPEITPPKLLILYYQNDVAKYVTRKYSTKKVKIFGSELFLLKKFENQIGIFGGFGAGSPVTATVVDLFCAFGVKQFLILGMAGGLQPNLKTGDLVLSTGAIREEGVSRHYLPESEIVESDKKLLESLSQALSAKKYAHTIGVTWTTDAPFREMKSEVNAYQNRGMLAVDMEAAAMLAVAQANQKSGLAAFSISDSLAGGEWVMPHDLSPAREGLFHLFESAVEAFGK